MIESSYPETWIDLQNKVAQILTESGLESETPKQIETARGMVEIDVFAVDKTQKPHIVYLCECKHWKTAIPQTMVHSLQTVLSNYGANFGLIISSNGFQSGALEAAQYSNVRLFTWLEFQELFEERWFLEHAIPLIQEAVGPLIDYTEPINSRVFCKADTLTPEALDRFSDLRKEYCELAFYASTVYLPWFSVFASLEKELPNLPLKDASGTSSQLKSVLPDELLNAVSLRDFLDVLLLQIDKGIKAFDDVFGGRA